MRIRAYLNGLYYVFMCIGFILTYYWYPYAIFYIEPYLSNIKKAWDFGLADYMTKSGAENTNDSAVPPSRRQENG